MASLNFAFAHGGGQGGWVWDQTIAAIAHQSGGAARYLALDVPGCGTKRGRDTGSVSFDDIVGELVADIEASGLRDLVLVGHSQAGMVLPAITERRPDLLRSLAYVTCSAPPPGMTTAERMGTGLHGQNPEEVGWPVDPEKATLTERLRAMFCNDMGDAEGDAFMALLGQDMWPMSSYAHRDWRYDHLDAIPSVFINCLRDMALPTAWQERFAETFRVDETIYIDAGHQVMTTRPQALAEVLLALASD